MTADAIAICTDAQANGGPSLSNFLLEHGRLPFVTDEIKPWKYSGWITAYVQLCEDRPGIAPRYQYALRTIAAGRLLDEPIPQIDFVGEGSAEAGQGMKMLEQMVKIAEYRSGFSRGFEEILKWLGFGLGVTDEQTAMDDREQEELYRLFDASKWLLAPTDYLGQFMAERSYGKAAAFFPTPMHLCTAMTAMTFGHAVKDGKDTRHLTTHDPCVGTGRFLLAASNYTLRLSGMDIMWAAVLATKINLALYAPWYLIPESVFPEAVESDQLPAVLSDTGPSASFQEKNAVQSVRQVSFSRERLWS